MYKLSKTSKNRLATCCPELQEIVNTAISDLDCPIDFGVVCGGRGKKDQEKAFADGFSKARWGQSDHNVMKGNKMYSLAVDLAPYSSLIKNYLWNDENAFKAMASHVMSVAARLGYKLEWGGDFVGFRDLPHFGIKFK